MKINKLEILNALNSAWIIADSSAVLTIEHSHVQIVMPIWASTALITISGKEHRVEMELELEDDIYSLGRWDIPRLNALLSA